MSLQHPLIPVILSFKASDYSRLNACLISYESSMKTSQLYVSSLLRPLLHSINLDNSHLLQFLMKHSQSRLTGTWAGVYAEGLKWIVIRGLKILHDSDFYLEWLVRLEKLWADYDLIAGIEEKSKDPNAPGVFSVIGVFCIVSYIERYTMMQKRDPERDAMFGTLENELVQHAASASSGASTVFPTAFVADFVIDMASGPGTEPRQLGAIMEFLSTYFAIVPVSVKNLDLLVSPQNIQQWREILLDESSDISSLSAASIIRNSAYFSTIFSASCEISVNDGVFVKICEGEFSVGVDEINAEKIPAESAQLLARCFLFIDSFCFFHHPVSPNASYCAAALKHDTIGKSFANWLLLELIDLKNGIAEDKVRVILSAFKIRILGEFCEYQESMHVLFSAIEKTTWKALSVDYGAYPEYFPLMMILWEGLHLYDMVGYSSAAALEIGISWHSNVAVSNSAVLAAKSYIHLFQQKARDIEKKRYLEQFECAFWGTDANSKEHIATFTVMIKILCSSFKISALSKLFSKTVLSLTYFDLLKIAASDKSSFFKVNLQLKSQSDTNEEEGGISEKMNDVVAASLFFRPGIAEIVPKYSQIAAFAQRNSSLRPEDVINNVLVSLEILDLPPKNEEHHKQITSIFLSIWENLATLLPISVFTDSVRNLANCYFPSEKHRMIEHIFCEFGFRHAWVFPLFNDILMEILTTPKLRYTSTRSPFNAYISHFTNFNVASSQDFTDSYIWQLSIGAAKILARMNIKVQFIPVYNFVDFVEFPRGLITFICDCLAKCSPAYVTLYFQRILAELNLIDTSADILDRYQKKIVPKNYLVFEILLASIIILRGKEQQNLFDEFINAVMINRKGDKGSIDKDMISFKFINLSLAQKFVTQYMKNIDNLLRTPGSEILKLILQLDYHENRELYIEIRETFFLDSFKQKDLFRFCWLPTIVQLALNSPLSIAFKLLIISITDLHSMAIVGTGSSCKLLQMLDNAASNPNVITVIENWEHQLCSSSESFNPEIVQFYSSKLSQRIRALIQNHVKQSLNRHPNVMLDIMHKSIDPLSSPSTFLPDIFKQCVLADESPDFQRVVLNTLKLAVSKTAFNMLTKVTQNSLERHELLQFLLICTSFLDADIGESLAVLSNFTLVPTMLMMLPYVPGGKLQSAILSFFLAFYEKIDLSQDESLRELKDDADTIWALKVGIVASVFIAKGNSSYKAFELLGTIARCSPSTVAGSFKKAVILHIISLPSVNSQWLKLLKACITTDTLAMMIEKDLKKWIVCSNGKPDIELIGVLLECISGRNQSLDSEMVFQLSQIILISADKIVCGMILDCFMLVKDSNFLVEHLLQITSCLREAILYDRVLKILKTIVADVKENPVFGRGQEWFISKVNFYLVQLAQKYGVGFDSIVFNVIKSLTSVEVVVGLDMIR